MKAEDAIEQSLELVENSRVALVGTIGEDGYPYIKAMFNAKHKDFEIWFSTNTSSKRVSQIEKNHKVSVYFVDMEKIKGLMLLGIMEIKKDHKSRKMLWEDGDERYYPLGVDDPDYTVLHFHPELGNFYYRLQNVIFSIK